MKRLPLQSVLLLLIPLYQSGCGSHADAEAHHESHKVVATSPIAKDVVITRPYVCQIRSRRHIDICAIEDGYLQEILVKEGQPVKKGDPMFRMLPVVYQAELAAAEAELQAADVELTNAEILKEKKIVSDVDVKLHTAKKANAEAKVKLAQARLNFADLKAPFDGIVNLLMLREGSLLKEGDILTTLSDNGVMWVYFNLPERRYLEYMAMTQEEKDNLQIQLNLANAEKFEQQGKITTVEAQFDNTTGNIPFRADFRNPDGLLRHGQTGTILMRQTLHNALIIPQRAVYEILDKQYVYVIVDEDVVKQREIEVQKNSLEDVFVVEKGLEASDRIVLEGKRQVRDGDKVEFEFIAPEKALEEGELKFHAE